MTQKSEVLEGRQCFVEAESTADKTKAVELYLKAARHYLNSARVVEDDTLKRSLVYLSNNCSHNATCRATASWKYDIGEAPINYSDTMDTSRLLHLAHLQRLKGVEQVPKRSEASSFQIVKDMLSLETALATIGFKSTKVTERATPPDNLLRSTFAFTSDLGESFMVLDPNSQAHVTGAAHPQQRHTTGRAPKSTGEGKPQRDPNRTVVQWNDVTVAESVILPSTRRQDSSANTTRELHPHDVERERGHEQQQHNLKREIENELSDPLLQSYLSTHSQQSTMLRSQNDVDNMSHSTINAFNKDTINNAAGVLNLLQTVRRIGEENTELLLRLEHLKHLEERSAQVYKDIDNFKQEFAEKFDDLKDLLMEHVCNMSELHRKSTPTGTPTGTPTRVGAGVRTGAGEVGGAGAAVVSAGGLELPLRDPLSSVILQEIRARKEAARGAVARADAEAGAEAAERKRRGRANAQEGRQGQGQGTVTASSHPAGIAESSAADQSSSAGGMSLVRQQQLEKMVKNILARLEKAQQEIKKKDALLEKYVRVINKLQQLRPKDDNGEIEGLDMSTFSVCSSSTMGTLGTNADSSGGDDDNSKRNAGGASVVSTYRKPPSPYNGSGSSSRGNAGNNGGASDMQADGFRMPPPPAAVTRASSSGTGLPPAGLSSPRRTPALPPRNKLPPNATTAMEFLQKNASK